MINNGVEEKEYEATDSKEVCRNCGDIIYEGQIGYSVEVENRSGTDYYDYVFCDRECKDKYFDELED